MKYQSRVEKLESKMVRPEYRVIEPENFEGTEGFTWRGAVDEAKETAKNMEPGDVLYSIAGKFYRRNDAGIDTTLSPIAEQGLAKEEGPGTVS